MLDQTRLRLALAIAGAGSKTLADMQRAREFTELKEQLAAAPTPAEVVAIAGELAALDTAAIEIPQGVTDALDAAFDEYDTAIIADTRLRTASNAQNGYQSNGYQSAGLTTGRNQCPTCPKTKLADRDFCFECYADRNPDAVDKCACGNTKLRQHLTCSPCYRDEQSAYA